MNAPLRTPTVSRQVGDLPSRDELSGRLNLAAFYANHAEDYLALGDHVGLEYALREFIRHARQVVEAAKALRHGRGAA